MTCLPNTGRRFSARVAGTFRAACLLVAGLVLACGSRTDRPDIVLIVIDTLRADHLGCYGYERPVSPAIDRLATTAVRFDRAYSAAPWTLPAFASILTGLYPWEHGASIDYFTVRESAPVLAEKLREAGYETAAFVSHIYTSSRYGFDRGYDTFEEFGLPADYAFDQDREPNAERVISKAVAWLRERDDDRPLFLTVHLFDPHWDYAAPPPWDGTFAEESDSFAVDGTYASIRPYLSRGTQALPEADLAHLRDLYDEEIRYTDAWIDTLLVALSNTAPRAAIALTADHGEEFGEHGGLGHAYTFYDEVLRVPLLLRVPGRTTEGAVRTDWVGSHDLYPTLLEIAGLADGDPPGAAGGSKTASGSRTSSSRSLLDEPPEPRFLFAGTNRDGRYGRALLHDGRKLVWDSDGAGLLETARDPAERRAEARADSLFARFVNSTTEGWELRWPGETALAGTVSVDGFVLDVLPLTVNTPPVSTTGNTHFTFQSTSGGDGGFRFRVAPPDAAVTFALSERDARITPDRIRIGERGFAPPSGRFTLDPARAPAGAFLPPARPRNEVSASGAVTLVLRPVTTAPASIRLTPEERDRLRALGYF